MAELSSAQLNDLFCSDLCCLLNQGELMAFDPDKHELLAQTATPDRNDSRTALRS